MTEAEIGAVPKAEMHVHLEACARPPLARAMAARYGETIDDIVGENGETYRWTDFTDFLRTYGRVADLFRTAPDYAELTKAYLDELLAANAIYAEIIVWPDHPERLGLSADDYLAGIDTGIAAHRARYGERAVAVRLLVTGVRHEGAQAVERAARTARRWLADGPRAADGDGGDAPLVVGFGLAGDERVGHPRDFSRAFDLAREAGLGLGCHAGELCGAQSVRDALDHLRPDRIDHGVRAIEDADLVLRLADEGPLLTVCPGSNLALGVVARADAHPLPALVRAGCRVALGSDDPPHFGTSLEGDYALAARMGHRRDDLLARTRHGIEGAHCDEATRARLLARLDREPGQA